MSLRDLALHLLDVAENSVNAGAARVAIDVREDSAADRLEISVDDDGRGMDAETAARVLDPFVTSRTTRKVGLGLPFLKAAAEACNGGLSLASTPGRGTRLEAAFQRSHIDRMPLGDLAATLLSLEVGYPSVHWQFTYAVDGRTFEFDDAEVKRELGDLPLSDPDVLAYLRDTFETGIESARQPAPVPAAL